MSENNKVKAIVFDIGNVLVDFRYEEHFKQFVSSQEEWERLVQATVLSNGWCELDRGVLSDEEILDEFIANDPEIEGILRMMFSNMDGILQMRDFAIPLVEELKGYGYEVIALSNMPHKMIRECNRDLHFLEHMTGAILSCEEQCVKPEKQIYKKLLSKYHLKGEECIFIDDLPKNIEAAREVGFYGICYGSYEQMREEMKSIIGR
ncbi:MAG: HAD family phosphatase [Eubacteriales bacterium]